MKGTIKVMNHSGDTALDFDTDLQEREGTTLTREEINAEFDRLVREGHLAFTMTDEHRGEQILAGEFDPQVHTKVLMSPAFVGG